MSCNRRDYHFDMPYDSLEYRSECIENLLYENDSPVGIFIEYYRGRSGKDGCSGSTGPTGPAWNSASTGLTGDSGATGDSGPTGAIGVQGHTGPTGPGFSLLLEAASFYALMPSDNTETVAPSSSVAFPQNGPILGSTISRISNTVFNISKIGIYLVAFQISITEPGQLVIVLNSIEQAYTVVGRTTGTSIISEYCLIEITTTNSTLSISNPVSATTALTITPLAGGFSPVSAQLTITKYS